MPRPRTTKTTPAGALPPPPRGTWVPQSVADVVERLPSPSTTSGRCVRPVHIARAIERLDAAVLEGGVNVAISTPPQNSKSTSCLAMLAFAALRRPGLTHIFASYSQTFAEQQAQLFRTYTAELGLDPQGPADRVELAGGTQVLFRGIGSAITGSPLSGVFVIDDPFKSAQDVDSPKIRDDVWQWYLSVANSRKAPFTRPSFVVVHTRWHRADLIGRLLASPEASFEYLRYAAICDDPETDPAGRALGQPLWPEAHPIESYSLARSDARNWNALYQGLPIAESEIIFRPATRYLAIPPAGVVGFGIDVATGAAKHGGDYSVLLGGTYDKRERVLYITRCARERIEPEAFVALVANVAGTAPVLFGHSSNEKYALTALRAAGVRAHGDDVNRQGTKLFRARKAGVVEAWNTGRIRVPDSDDRWVRTFVDEIENFTGTPRDAFDDQVDALTSLWTLLAGRDAAPAQRIDLSRVAAAWRGDSEAPAPRRPRRDHEAERRYRAAARESGLDRHFWWPPSD